MNRGLILWLLFFAGCFTGPNSNAQVSLAHFCLSPTHKLVDNRVLIEIGFEGLRYRGWFHFVRTNHSYRERAMFGSEEAIKDSDLAVVPIVVSKDVNRLSDVVHLSGVRALCNGKELKWAEAGSFRELGDDEQVKVAFLAFEIEGQLRSLDSYVIEVDFTQPCERLGTSRRVFCYFENYVYSDSEATPPQTIVPSKARFEVRGFPRVELRRPVQEAGAIGKGIDRSVEVAGLYEFVIE